MRPGQATLVQVKDSMPDLASVSASRFPPHSGQIAGAVMGAPEPRAMTHSIWGMTSPPL